MYTWICNQCSHEVVAESVPDAIRWNDGHICRFWLVADSEYPKCHKSKNWKVKK